MNSARRNARLALASMLLTLPVSGCVRRRLTVRTNPPGAVVSVDNQVIGASPAASTFTFYGTREFRIERDGYRTETIRRQLNPPWYQYPPLDFITETLWPWEIRDERVIDVELVPKEVVPVETVIERAEQLRQQSRSGVVTGPSAATPAIPTISAPTIPPPAASGPEQLPYGGVPLNP